MIFNLTSHFLLRYQVNYRTHTTLKLSFFVVPLELTMAVPKKKTSVSRKGMRHAGQHHKLTAKTVSRDQNTGDYLLSHRVSPSGMYKGIKVFMTKADKKALLEGQTAEE